MSLASVCNSNNCALKHVLCFKVLKVAILSEKYASDYTWYVDTILQLIRVAGDYVSEEVWHRVIQIVINRDDAQGYAAKTVFEVTYLLFIQTIHVETMRVSAYLDAILCPVFLLQVWCNYSFDV